MATNPINAPALEPDTDEWWVQRLYGVITRRASHVKLMRSWYEGDPPIPFPDSTEDPDADRAWRSLQKMSRVNVASLVVDARLTRLRVNGVQTPSDYDSNGDDELNDFMQDNDFRIKARAAWRDALVSGRGYLVLSDKGLMHSSPESTVCEKDAFGNVIAALSMHTDVAKGRRIITLARPGYSRQLSAAIPASGAQEPIVFDVSLFSPIWGAWDWGDRVPTGLETVPVYEFEYGKGMVCRHLPTLQRINHTLLQRGIMIATQAFKLRGLRNAPALDANGEKIQYNSMMFSVKPNAFWVLPGESELWESGAVDVTPVSTAIQKDLITLAAESKTPLFMITPDAADGSAEGATAQRETNVLDVSDLQDTFAPVLKRLFADAMRLKGDESRATTKGMVIDWVEPVHQSAAEKAAAVLSATSAGTPLSLALKWFAGAKPEELEELERAEGAQNLRDLIANSVANRATGSSADNPGGLFRGDRPETPASGAPRPLEDSARRDTTGALPRGN